jgi:hypothetical protein
MIQASREKVNRKPYYREYYLSHREGILLHGKEYDRSHREQRRLSDRLRYPVDRDKRLARYKLSALKIKVLVMTHYGKGKAVCLNCGENRLVCLSIDHINGDGSVQRKANKFQCGNKFYRWLIKAGYPDGYQTLCMNCQFVKELASRKEKPMSLNAR